MCISGIFLIQKQDKQFVRKEITITDSYNGVRFSKPIRVVKTLSKKPYSAINCYIDTIVECDCEGEKNHD
jgi:hypothetical protein